MENYVPAKHAKEEINMKRTDLRRRMLSLALALTLLVSMMSIAYATDDGKCVCGATYNRTVLHQANCHEYGVVEYVCTKTGCQYANESILVKVNMDPSVHDAVYKDNGDGATHTATCLYHTSYRNVSEKHTFVSGVCSKCGAADYAEADIVVQSSMEVYVSLKDTQATLSLGDVAMKVGNVDVTDNYTVSYSWMDQTGATVGSGKSFKLPAAVVAKEGDYTYGCFVMAMPKAGTAGKYVSESCTITVRVRDLVLASATVNTDDDEFALGTTNSRTPVSVTSQIYQAAYKLSSARPSYVIFGAETSADVGELSVADVEYYFNPSAAQEDLDDVVFYPYGTEAGSYVINFTVYDAKGNDFPGVLTVNVEQDLGALDVAYVTTPGDVVKLNAFDFASFWQKHHDRGSLTLVKFKSLPIATDGVLYYNYVPGAAFNTTITTADALYNTFTSADQKLLGGVTFVPDSKFTGNVTIPFEAHGLTVQGQYALLDGELTIFVSSGSVRKVAYTANAGATAKFSAADFLSVHQIATGATTMPSDFTIKLLEVPTNGALYVDYTATLQDVPLTAATVKDFSFHYSSAISQEIADLTYLAPKTTSSVTDTIRYVACDNRGTFLYVGEITLAAKPSVVVYTKSFTDVVKTANTEWYYTAVMDLAEAGVIGGMTPTTFEPGGKVTYGQALKLVMLAAGYEKQVEESGPNWAKNYLTLAQREGLISATYTEAILNRVIARNEIAQIAAKAMKLPASALTTSPFADVVVGSTYAPYIFSLYDAGIVTGTELSNGTTVYYGVNAITRAEMSVIVWRINNYSK